MPPFSPVCVNNGSPERFKQYAGLTCFHIIQRWVILEFFGDSLLDFMKATAAPLEEKVIKIIMQQTLTAVTYLHKQPHFV